MKKLRMKSVVNEAWKNDDRKEITKEDKRKFQEAVANFNEFGSKIYRSKELLNLAEDIGGIVEIASNLTLSESDEWFDAATVKRHVKHVRESYKVFQKTAKEMQTLQQRLEHAYEDMGTTLGKYYNINEKIDMSKVDEGATQNQTINMFFKNKTVKDIIRKEYIKVVRNVLEKEGYDTKKISDIDILKIKDQLK